MASSANPFAALDSDDEDLAPKTSPPKREGGSKASKGSSGKSKPSTVKQKAPVADTARNGEKGDRRPRGDRDRPTRGGGDGDRPQRSNRPERERGEKMGGKHRDRAPPGGHGAHAHSGHDRRSGTGRAPGVKKQGGGGHNWGTQADDVDLSEQTGAGPEGEDGEAVNAETNGAAQPEEAEPEPEPEVQMSFEEYQAKLAAERADGELFGDRDGKSVDISDFDGSTMKRKEEQDLEEFLPNTYVRSTKGKDGAKKIVNKRGEKFRDVGFKAPALERPGREQRGGRGGNRGDGHGGGYRAGKEQIDVNDTSAFPSLG